MASLDGGVSVARARRRPARYSPELSAAQQQSDMCIGTLGAASEAATTNGTEAASAQDPQQEDHENEEANEAEMAPAPKRPKHKPKRRYKKRQTEDNCKRPRVANVLLENEMLIDEIRVRKALWMRTHDQHHSSTLTAPLWEEIATALDTTQENVRRRWKSLKDHYRREFKKSMNNPTAPPSIWPYYKKMRFMNTQMFVSLRCKNGEDHLEILSDDEDDINNQWNGQVARKQEGGSDTMDDYEMSRQFELIKYEQHMQQLSDDVDGTQEEEEEEEEEDQQQQQAQQEDGEDQMQEQDELPPIDSMHEQEELSALQQQAELSELSNLSTIQQQPVITTDMSTMTTIADMVGIPTVVTTTASALNERLSDMQQRVELSGRLSAMQQRASELGGTLIQRPTRLSDLQQNGNLSEEMDPRHSGIQQQQINGRITAMQRNSDMTIQQRANLSALHERVQMQQTVNMRRNGVVDNTNPTAIIAEGLSDDYHFFMSLLPHVKHFNSLQKLKLRNRIQQIIIEESSNRQYDPLGNC